MNWNLIAWFAGVVLTIYGLKFVLTLAKSLFGKEAREEIIDSIGSGISNVNKKITKTFKKRADERKRKKAEENRAIVRVL